MYLCVATEDSELRKAHSQSISPVHVVLNDEQLSELTEHGQLTVRLHRPAR